jgi:uncharacterized protein (TIGR03790 family)
VLRAAWLVLAGTAFGQGPSNVLVVINDSSSLSRSIGEYYARRRAVPLQNVCRIRVSDREEIARDVYDRAIAKVITRCLAAEDLRESILYIVTTSGVPLRIAGSEGPGGDVAAVDSELTLLYRDMRNGKHRVNGLLPNPFFGRRSLRFRHPEFPIYLVTRLAGYDFEDVKAMIDRGLMATNRGKVVIDLAANGSPGDDWLRAAAARLPQDRVVFDDSPTVLYDQKNVIAYAAWGSNDKNRRRRRLGFQWLPGAIATEYVSTNGRTFRRPPDDWNIGSWADTSSYFAGSPQSLTADYIHEGATGASGHVAEPFLQFSPRPDYILPAYLAGRNLAESFYLGIPALSWQNIVVGDPLCRLGLPGRK